MQIKKNIAATLKKAMNDQGMTLMEFSKELDLPRTTTQGYLCGRTAPRGDTLEHIAEKLGISVAALISGPEYSELGGISCLERVLGEIQMLHPNARSIANEALGVLRSAFCLSDALLDCEAKTELQETSDIRFRYVVHELWDPFRRSASFGLLAKERFPEGWTTVAVVAALSKNKTVVTQLANKCTQLQLVPEQLLDVVHDFLAADSFPT